MLDKVIIRSAKTGDAEILRNIYAPYVEHTAVTFEYEVPSVLEFAARMEKIQEKYPYLVAEENEEILGYVYASTFKARAAYDWAVETSIYIREDQKRRGLGQSLYKALEEALESQNILNLYACISNPENEDKYLTKDSVKFHERMGYRMIGEFRKCGYKFNRWYNMVWMEKCIGEHMENPAPVRIYNKNGEE